MQSDSKIYIAGHQGLVGHALFGKLKKAGFLNLITRTHSELDLTNQLAVQNFFAKEKPDYVFLAAAKVGGIMANQTYPAQFIYENLQIQNNVIHQAFVHKVKKLLFLGSSCIYPKNSPQPIKEESLLTDKLEPTNEPYAVAKIAGIKMCQSYNRQYGTNFIAAMPTNLYGPNDNFDQDNAHVLPALIHKFHQAKIENLPEITLWGDGTPRREFLFVEDLADGLIKLMHKFNPTPEQNEQGDILVNIGTGEDLEIKKLAELIKNIVEFEGNIKWDLSKPNGTYRKLLNINKIKSFGWIPTTALKEGMTKTYDWFKNNN